MYKLITSATNTNDLSIGFDRDRGRSQRELTNNKNIKGKCHIRIYSKDVFGFAEHQGNAAYGLTNILTLTWNTDNAVLKKDESINNAKIMSNVLEWYVPHYTPSIPQQGEYPKFMDTWIRNSRKNQPPYLDTCWFPAKG